MKNKLATIDHEERDNRLVRRDLNLVIVLNAILLAVLLGAYLVNRSSGAVDKLFQGIVKF